MAVHQALLVRQWSSDVTLFLHTLDEPADEDRDRLAARGVRVVTGRVTGLQVETGRLRGVRLADGTVVARTALFVGPRVVAHDGLLTALGAQSEHSPVASWVTTDPTGATTVPGVWAAGNVADPTAQVIGAAGAGSRAAIAINGDLVAEDTRRAVAARSTASRADAAGSRRAAGHSPG
jgi:thioredoxin reductase